VTDDADSDDFVVQLLRENRRLKLELRRLEAIASSRWWRLHPRLNLQRALARLRGTHDFVDAALSWSLLAIDGFLVFDDYGWSALGVDPLLGPRAAIEAFLTLVDGKYAVVSEGSQLALRKTSV